MINSSTEIHRQRHFQEKGINLNCLVNLFPFYSPRKSAPQYVEYNFFLTLIILPGLVKILCIAGKTLSFPYKKETKKPKGTKI